MVFLFPSPLFRNSEQSVWSRERVSSHNLASRVRAIVCSENDLPILTAYIISPLRGKGSSSSNSSVLYLRASGMMHCGLRFKYHNFSRLVVSSTGFGEVAVKVSPLPPPLVVVNPVSYIYTPLALAGILP